MTGAPAETSRKFTFSTTPAWAVALLPLVCLGLLPLFIGLYLVSRRASGRLPLTRASSRRVALASWIPAGMTLLSFLLGIAAFVVLGATSSTTTRVSSSLVYTKWVVDANVTGGPEVGFKPSLTGLSGGDIQTVTARNDTSTSPGGWLVDITFTSRGRDLFDALTRDNVAACPGDATVDSKANCAQRHLALWLGLTQADIDRWEDATYVDAVSQPWGSGGKLLGDLLTLEEINSGEVLITGNFTQSDAQDLVAAIEPTSTSSSPAGSLIGGVLGGLALLTFIAALVCLVVLRRLIGPRGAVMGKSTGYADRLVELRRLHPAFAEAVRQMQLARAAAPPPPPPPQPFVPGSN
ncbi:MAG TPA: hypothetical protein VNU19_02265 [Candidatus Acidoferrum sp.]|jgi:hypothetical protein|nr:hypothetical protein [Candidatus Acidoferrum sp.]